MATKAHTALGELVKCRACFAFVAVTAHAVGAERVDDDEQHVHVVALRETLDVLRGSDRAIVLITDLDVVDRGEVDAPSHDPDCGREDPRPTLTED